MRTVLIAFDGSADAEGVVRRVVREARGDGIDRIHLLNVQTPLGGYVSQFVGSRTVREFQRDAGEAALAVGKRLLDMAGCDYRTHVRIGDAAKTILRTAVELGVSQIVMGTGGPGLLARLAQYLLIARVIRRAAVPVVILAAAQDAFARPLPVGGPGSTALRS